MQFSPFKTRRYVSSDIVRSLDPTLQTCYMVDGIKRFRPMESRELERIELGFTLDRTHTMSELMFTDFSFGEGRGRSAITVTFPTIDTLVSEENVEAIRKANGRYVAVVPNEAFSTDNGEIADFWESDNGIKSYATAKATLKALIEESGLLADNEVVSLSDRAKKGHKAPNGSVMLPEGTLLFTIRTQAN